MTADRPVTIDEIPWEDPGGPPTPRVQTAEPRRCRHPRDRRRRVEFDDGQGTSIEVCESCGHRFDPAMQRRGRAVRKYGKAAELRDARAYGLEPRGTNRDPEDSGGAMDPAVLQSKTGPGFASLAWIRELEALEGVAHGRPRILIATEKPGRGNPTRRLVVMLEAEFVQLTGLDARRRNLESLVAALKERIVQAWRSDDEFRDEVAVLLEQLEVTPAR